MYGWPKRGSLIKYYGKIFKIVGYKRMARKNKTMFLDNETNEIVVGPASIIENSELYKIKL